MTLSLRRLLPFLLVVHTRLDLGLKSRAFLPFLAGDGKDPVVGVQVSGIKSHRRVLALLNTLPLLSLTGG